MTSLRNAIIYLIGFAGTGKLTIAKEIQKQLPSILVDNHSVNNVIFSLIDTDGKSELDQKVWDNVKLVKKAVLNTIRDVSNPERNFIFTNELVDGVEGEEAVFEQIVQLASDRKARLFPVRLLIEPDELVKRVVSADRVPMFKEIDSEAAFKKATEKEVYKPKNGDYFDLDVTNLSPAESAGSIVGYIERRKQA